MNVLDLFSGIGGFSLGLERAGFKTVAFCEIEPFPRAILKEHWPDVPCYEDVRTLTAQQLRADGISVDVICGGFPCQDISAAGRQAGIEVGTRSGLWSEIVRLSGELRPRYVIVENVAALLSNGMGRVLGDLAALGYDAEWHCIPASAVGAPHRRDRVWIVAYPRHGFSCGGVREGAGEQSSQREGWNAENEYGNVPVLVRRLSGRSPSEWWRAQSRVARSADGVPDWSHRVKSLGNAVVPQIPEMIGRAIMCAT